MEKVLTSAVGSHGMTLEPRNDSRPLFASPDPFSPPRIIARRVEGREVFASAKGLEGLQRVVRRFRFIWFWVVRYSSFEAEPSGVRSESERLQSSSASSARHLIVAKVSVPSSILKMARTTLPMLFL